MTLAVQDRHGSFSRFSREDFDLEKSKPRGEPPEFGQDFNITLLERSFGQKTALDLNEGFGKGSMVQPQSRDPVPSQPVRHAIPVAKRLRRGNGGAHRRMGEAADSSQEIADLLSLLRQLRGIPELLIRAPAALECMNARSRLPVRTGRQDLFRPRPQEPFRSVRDPGQYPVPGKTSIHEGHQPLVPSYPFPPERQGFDPHFENGAGWETPRSGRARIPAWPSQFHGRAREGARAPGR
jgi:hypothetical protein